jgi:uncharacterized cupin superfamily protein
MLIKADVIKAMAPIRRQHQFNENAIRVTRALSDVVGMERIGIHLVRLEPGRESTQFHYHDADEEFLYVLQGCGIAEIGDDEFEVGPGDFMGFVAPSKPHSMRNPFKTDLVYLMGGERNSSDVVHYPRIRRSLIKSDSHRTWVGWDDLHEI